MNQSDAMTQRLRALGTFIRFYRRDRKLKQDEVAERIGVTKNTVSQIELGKQWPSMQTYLRILDVLELNRYDVTDEMTVHHEFTRSKAKRDLGLADWYKSLNEDELRYGMMKAWEGVELMREMERRGLKHPFKRFQTVPLELLAPDELSERSRRAVVKVEGL